MNADDTARHLTNLARMGTAQSEMIEALERNGFDATDARACLDTLRTLYREMKRRQLSTE